MKYEVKVSPDKMTATLTLVDDGIRYEPTESEIMEALRRSGVKYGIIYENIKSLLERPVFDTPVVVAKGKPPVSGEDGRVEIKRFVKDIPPGKKFDPREFASKNRIIVKKGEEIGKLVRPTQGVPGVNVLGEKIKPNPGKPAKMRIGEGIKILEDGTLVADKEGLLMVSGDSVYIEDIFVVKGDVDYSVGNIDFPGVVEINGDVKPGFVVRAKKDIYIKGIVEAATVISYEGSIEIGGVKGQNKGMIKAKFDVKAKFLENAHVEAGRNVEVEGPITNSVVKSKGSVIATGRKGVIVGGVTSASRSIEAEEIGSELGVKTILEIGIDPDLREEEKLLSAQIQLDEQNLEKLLLILRDFKRMIDIGKKLPPQKREMYAKVSQTIIHLRNSIDENKKRLMEIRKRILTSRKNVRIVAKRMMYPGVEVTMFQRSIKIDRPLKAVVLVYDEKKGEIIARGYSG